MSEIDKEKIRVVNLLAMIDDVQTRIRDGLRSGMFA